MKFVSLVVISMIFSIAASAQNAPVATEKRTAAQNHQKIKVKKARSVKKKTPVAKGEDVITLNDEKSYKAKWTFEEMLKRRLEVDAAENERKRKKG